MNQSIVGVGKDLKRSSDPTPLPKQVPLEKADQVGVQMGLE